MITVYEAARVVPDRVYQPAHAAFPRVRFVDSKGDGANGRLPVEYQKNVLHYSVPDPKVGRDLPKCVVEATYLVNMTLVKGHPTTGVSLTAKNHYGTVDVRDHEVYVNSHSHPMATYHPFVDMIGSKELGGKTLLFILDGLYGVRDVNDNVAEHGHWNKLFHGEWLASLFVSQDPIAIDSVGFDFIRSEFPFGRFTDFQPTKNADNYMHEAALADHPPSGIDIRARRRAAAKPRGPRTLEQRPGPPVLAQPRSQERQRHRARLPCPGALITRRGIPARGVPR